MTTSDDGRRSIVAVADDDPRILESLGILLESAGYDARLFPSATALLESGAVHEIECLISDVGMPVMDGFELARAVQAGRPALPVILITGRPDWLHRSPLDWPRDCRVLKKPFDGQELLKAVGDALRSMHCRRPRP